MNNLTWQDVVTSTVELGGNKEQNAHFPPYIITNAGNLLTNVILNELVRIYPNSQSVIDKARPFLKRKIVAVDNSLITLPSDYRNILDVSIPVVNNKSCECSKEFIESVNCEDKTCGGGGELVDVCNPNSPLYNPEIAARPKEYCEFKKVYQVDQDQWDDRMRSQINRPSLDKPIYMFVSPTEIKICPANVSHVEIRYIKQPKIYNMAYVDMPDDTWQIDKSSPDYVELEWDLNISPEFFKGMLSLYAVHTRDGNLVNWNNALKKEGIF